MPNVNAKRNDNRVPTLVASDGSGNTYPFYVDTATSRLLIDVQIRTTTSPGTLSGTKRDDNRVPVAYATLDNGSGTLSPIMVDTTSGLPFVDVNIE